VWLCYRYRDSRTTPTGSMNPTSYVKPTIQPEDIGGNGRWLLQFVTYKLICQ
jgi:hypothetical protein